MSSSCSAQRLVAEIAKVTDLQENEIREGLAKLSDKYDSSPPEPDGLWTIDEVAIRLAVSKRTVEYLIADGEIQPVRIRKRTRRFDPAAIEAFIRRRAQ